jgi:murein L,D-transpeptidase YcbB/YkuD
MRRGGTFFLLLSFALLTCACGRLSPDHREDAELQQRLRTELRSSRPAFVGADAEGAALWTETRRFYAARQNAPAWIHGKAPRPQMDALISAIRSVDAEGLDPALYGLGALEARRREAARGFLTKKGFEPREAAALDVWLTYLYMKLASDLADGLVDLSKADSSWQIRPEKFNPLKQLEGALEANRIAESLAELLPTTAQYRSLRDALSTYRAQASKGTWPTVWTRAKLKPDDRSIHVGAIARRLFSSGDCTVAPASDDRPRVYSGELVECVKRFQRRHGLEDDGVIGASVIAAMNVPIDARIRQIELNMERWRWLPRDLGKRYILVNVPTYHLDVWDEGRIVLSMRVVVGKKDSPTPIFEDRMTYLVFSPYWNVPVDIVRDETLPALLNDPAFLQRVNMEVIDQSGAVVDPASIDLSDSAAYRFRQRPGGSNALGLVKFMFPNQYNVYLHDTPANSLFDRTGRSLSHGCVRVQQPEALAAYLLRDQPEWTPEQIAGAMHAGEERTVKLKQQIPVYLGYWTAYVTPENSLQFAPDIYDIDARQSAKLKERLDRLRRTTARSPAQAAK